MNAVGVCQLCHIAGLTQYSLAAGSVPALLQCLLRGALDFITAVSCSLSGSLFVDSSLTSLQRGPNSVRNN